MNESDFVTRGEFGRNRLKDPTIYGPPFTWPPRPGKLRGWMFGMPRYILHWTLAPAAIGAAVCFGLSPPFDQSNSVRLEWILHVALANCAIAFVGYGTRHPWLILLASPGTNFKYDRSWPSAKSALFMSGRQNAEHLHHKPLEVNHADRATPPDRWFASFHDGTLILDDRLRQRIKKRAVQGQVSSLVSLTIEAVESMGASR